MRRRRTARAWCRRTNPVGVRPVAARAVAAIDDRNGHVRHRGEGVDERHAHRARPDDHA